MTINLTDVVVQDCGVDACLVQPSRGGRPILVVSPNQTFGFAAKAVARLMPEASDSEIRALLRTKLHNSIDVDDLIERRHAEDAYKGTWAAWTVRLIGALVTGLVVAGTMLMLSSGHGLHWTLIP